MKLMKDMKEEKVRNQVQFVCFIPFMSSCGNS
jgi:hypothetical protein